MSGRKVPATKPRNAYQFIVLNEPGAPEDPETRTLIRRQAMRDIGLARRRKAQRDRAGAQQDWTVRTTDKFISVACDATSSASSSSSELDGVVTPLDEATENVLIADELDDVPWTNGYSSDLRKSRPLYTMTLRSGYEKTRALFEIDLRQLSILTNFSIGRTAIPRLSANPGKLALLLELQQWSFLEYVPSRYNSSPCIAAATDCVLAKAKSVLAPTVGSTRIVWQLYAKALRCIQDAISDPASNVGPDILCAVQLLSLHELLDCSRGEAWTSHTNGAARLIMHLSSRRFKTEYEKALVATHAGAMVSEAIMSNQPCYLEAPEWTQLLSSLALETETLSDRSPLILNVRIKLLSLPTLWHDISKLMNSERLFDKKAMEEMEDRCRSTHADYLQWFDEYNAHCSRRSFVQARPEELELRRELFGTVCECLVLVKRFWACLADDKRLQLEIESQALAQLLFGLQNDGAPRMSWLFSVHEISMAEAVVATQAAFEEDVRHLDVFERRLASRRRYNLFSRSMLNS